VVQWVLSHGQACYPTGTGTFEATAPNTTATITLSHDDSLWAYMYGDRDGVLARMLPGRGSARP